MQINKNERKDISHKYVSWKLSKRGESSLQYKMHSNTQSKFVFPKCRSWNHKTFTLTREKDDKNKRINHSRPYPEAYCPISIVFIFRASYFRHKRDFPTNCRCVRKGVTVCPLCQGVKVTPIFVRLILALDHFQTKTIEI